MVPGSCPECGSYPESGLTCRQVFEAALALEYENPRVFGRVHHFTVTCYNLQHPSQYTPDALDLMEKGLRELVKGDIQPADLRAVMGRTFSGSQKVVRKEPAPARLRRWNRTTADLVIDGGADAFVESVRQWARSIVEEMDR
jgi:hypothetical protein